MSFLNFPKRLAVKVLDNNESYSLGGYRMANNEELYALRLKTFSRGTINTGAKIKVEIYADPNYIAKVATTEEITLTSGNFLGFHRLILSTSLNMKANQYYYFKVVSSGYTRTNDTSYIGIVLDFPYGVYNTSSSIPFIPSSMELYVLR